jgi:DNA segregation ATPase FtsK/SpoIIIE, S-DNA-T family
MFFALILERFFKGFLGFFLVGLGLFLGAALFTYVPWDPSWNVAVSGEARNLFGWEGAHWSDFLLQWYGCGSFILPFFMVLTAWSVVGTQHPWVVLCAFLFLIVELPWFLKCLALGQGLPDYWAYGVVAWLFPFVSSPFVFSGMVVLGLLLLMAISLLLGKGKLSLNPIQTFCSVVLQGCMVFFRWVASLLLYPLRKKSHALGKKKKDQRNQRKGMWPDFQGTSEGLGSGWITPNAAPLSHGQESEGKNLERQKKMDSTPSGHKNPLKESWSLKQKLFDGLQNVVKTTYHLPSLKLIMDPLDESHRPTVPEMQKRALQLQAVLDEFGVKGAIKNMFPGPVVTLFELEPGAGLKSVRVISLADDIARSMSATSCRVAVVPGKNLIGIELPNPTRKIVYLKEMLSTSLYTHFSGPLALTLGQDISGNPVIVDLATMPHLLVAGTTGSGKSVSVNGMILSLLFRLPPENCRFIMIDPKMLELSVYDGIPHLLAPVVTDSKKALGALKWVVKEMESRYRTMSLWGVRNIEGYNSKVLKGGELPPKVLLERDLEPHPQEPKIFPYIVVVVDELADLMLVAGKEVEVLLQRLAQMARAAGIHLILATQRPSVDVITGTIKANFPTRISFQVTSKIDSRTILGEQGAEQLLGRGDMLYMSAGGRMKRVHGVFASDLDVERVVQHLKESHGTQYEENFFLDEESDPDDKQASHEDPLYQEAIEIVRTSGKISTSYLQRRLQIGYNRAARLMESMEHDGIVSPASTSGKREVLS